MEKLKKYLITSMGFRIFATIASYIVTLLYTALYFRTPAYDKYGSGITGIFIIVSVVYILLVNGSGFFISHYTINYIKHKCNYSEDRLSYISNKSNKCKTVYRLSLILYTIYHIIFQLFLWNLTNLYSDGWRTITSVYIILIMVLGFIYYPYKQF